MRTYVNLIRSLCYAGILSSILGMVVDIIAANWDDMPSECFGLVFWTLNWRYHKNKGTW